MLNISKPVQMNFSKLFFLFLLAVAPFLMFALAKVLFGSFIVAGLTKYFYLPAWMICIYVAIKLYVEFLKLFYENEAFRESLYYTLFGTLVGLTIACSCILFVNELLEIEVNVFGFWMSAFNGAQPFIK